MSFNLTLIHPRTGRVIHSQRAHHITGGRPVVGGRTELSITVPLIFAPLMVWSIGKLGIRTIYGMTGIEAAALLDAAVNKLEDQPSTPHARSDPTETNVRYMLIDIINLSRLARRGIWQGD